MTSTPTVTRSTRIQLCGRLSVEIGGTEIVDGLRGRQVRLLLAYLILNRLRQVSRDELSEALWPYTAPQSQDGALRTVLSRLRSAVGPDVLAGREQLALQLPEPVWVDFEAARTEVARAEAALEQGDMRTAWVVGQVPLNVASRGLLPGIQASWLEPPRLELEQVCLQALEVIGRAGLGLGGSQLAGAERAARAMIASEPYRESAYTLLMQALAAQGNVAEGLRVFEQLRTLLRQELGTVPSPDALVVHEQLLNPQPLHDSSAAAAVEPAAPSLDLPPGLGAHAPAPLVGRARELAELERLWAVVCTGAVPRRSSVSAGARVVALAGDPGVGKTRLAVELARRAHEQGAVVLAGQAPEDSLTAYQPFLEALRHYVVSAPLSDLRAAAHEYGPELVRLVPELRRRLPDLPASEVVEPETERYRLFEAVVGLLSAISRSAPILLVLDDLHWADRPTLLLLRHLARAPDPRRLLILVVHRAIDSSLDGVAAVLADLRREQLPSELQIGGLSEEETAQLVRQRTGEAPSRSFIGALHEETEGNPLFVEEIVCHLTDAGVHLSAAVSADVQRFGLPEGVKQVIARRLGRYDAAATEWLRVAAVIGRDFDAALLEQVLGSPEEDFLDVLEQVLDGNLVVERSGEPGRYTFCHALIREVLYEAMSAPRRARIHRRIGEALEAGGHEGELAPLAYHFTRAASEQDALKAVGYALAAGERASAQLAYEQAAEHYARGLEVLEHYMPADSARRCELLLALGEARMRAGDPAPAWTALKAAAAVAEELGDHAALARAAIAASRRHMQQPGVVDHELIALLERALELTRGERTAMRVLLLARLCGALYFSPARWRMRQLSEEANDIAEQLGQTEARVYARAARRRALWDPARLDERLQASTEMLTFARQAGNLEQQLHAHAWLVVDLLEQGDIRAVDAQIEAFSVGAATLRQPSFTWHAAVWRAMRAMLAGRLEAAESLAREALAVGASAESVSAQQYYGMQLLAIRHEQDRLGELEDSMRAVVAGGSVRPPWRAALAELLLSLGRMHEAQALLEELAGADFSDMAHDGDRLTAATVLSGVACGLGDRRRAALLYELLAPYADHHVVIGLGAACLGSVQRYLGNLALATDRRDDAIGHLERAVVANERLEATVEVAHSRLDLAQALGPGTDFRRLVDAVALSAQEFGLPRVMRRMQALASR